MFTSSIITSFVCIITDIKLSSYAIYANENQNIAKITIDKDLNYQKQVKSLIPYTDITAYDIINVIPQNNSLYIIACNTNQDVFEDISIQTFVHFVENNFETNKCGNIINQNNSTDGGFAEDSSQSLIQESNETVSFVYIKNWTFDLSNSDNLINNTQIYNLTSCIWPRYSQYTPTCNYTMPQFQLPVSLLLDVSLTNQSDLFFSPFNSCRGELFIIQILENSTMTVPNWINVYENNQTFSIIRSKISSVGSFVLNFRAQLVAYTVPINDYTKYSTSIIQSSFIFRNTNCVVQSYSAKSYVVIGQNMTISIQFYDLENDSINLKFSPNYLLNIVSLNLTQLTKNVTIVIEANTNKPTQSEFVILYTDYYHMDQSMWKNITLTINLFLSEPPIFNESLSNINLDGCRGGTIKLPPYYDPDSSDSVTLSLPPETPSWIVLNPNNTIYFNTTDESSQIDTFTEVSITLTDSTNAFTIYSFNVTVEPVQMDNFNNIESMSFSCPVSAFFPVDVSSDPNITVVNCLDYSISNFVTYIGSMHSLFINATTEYQCANTNLRYKSVDSCGNPYYSNCFWIYLDRGQPPAVTYTFGPLSINYGVSKLFEIPYDLFTSSKNQSLKYNINNCINVEAKNTEFEIVSHNEYINSSNIVTQFFLSVISFDRFSVCNFPITAKNLMGGSSEYTTQLNMIVCSSKDCTDCTGPYQSDCIKCKDGFTLQSSGICLQTNSPFSFDGFDFYSILGLITCIIIVVQLIASFKLKHLSLLPISYSQTILIFLCSNENLNQNTLLYISWIQWTNLNFGFIYSQTFQNILNCEAKSVRFINAKMYCQSTIQNYLIIFALILFILTILFILKKFFRNYDQINIIFRKLSIIFLSSKSQGKLIFISLTPFLFSNIVNDFMYFEEHAILSILSIILLVLCIIYSLHNVCICANKEAVLKASAISYNHKFCSSLVLSVLLTCMFLQTHSLFYLLSASSIVLFYCVVICIQLMQRHEADKETIKLKNFQTDSFYCDN